jgi:hypothetical protein
MSEKERKTLSDRFLHDDEVDKAVTDAVRKALSEHARKGNEVVVWEDGKPVWKTVDSLKLRDE